MKKTAIYIIMFAMAGIFGKVSLACDCEGGPPGSIGHCWICYCEEGYCEWQINWDAGYNCGGVECECPSGQYCCYLTCWCQECCNYNDYDCPVGQHCNNDTCVECYNHNHCAAQGKVCDLVNHQCIACQDPAHPCPDGKVCLDGTCVCLSRANCNGCVQCCVNNQCTGTCPCTGGYNYDRYRKVNLKNVTGIHAEIKVRYGNLCGVHATTDLTFYIAYVSAATSNPNMWGQTGYGMDRYEGSANVFQHRYVEVKIGLGMDPQEDFMQLFDYINFPDEGSYHDFKCILDGSGTWYFYDNEDNWCSIPTNYWINTTCDRATYAGEILKIETDMPGTSENKCNFRNCQYMVGWPNWQNAGFVDGDADNWDSNEWGNERISGTEFNIWDKKPN